MIRQKIRQIIQDELKLGPLHFLADAFAALVILSSFLFLAYDSIYILSRYIPRVILKVKNRVMIDPDAEDAVNQGSTLDLGKALKGAQGGRNDDDD